MCFNLVFLTVIFWVSGLATAQSFPVATTKIFNFANSDDSERLFYTHLSEISVFETYDPADYPVSKDLGIAMLAERPKNCSCPDLRKILSVTTPYQQLRFERSDKWTADLEVHGLAGYLAPFPGYCGSDQVELIEFYSPVLKVFRYDTANNIYNYFSDYKNQFRPVRVLGYAYYSTPSVWLSGNAPFIVPGLESPFYKAISVRFDMVRKLTKNGKTSFAVSPQLIDAMVSSDGWTLTDEVRPGPMSSQNELEKIREICGGANYLERCRETFDNTTGLYRPINLDEQGLGGKTVAGDCGYFLSNTFMCFQLATKMYSYIPSYNGNQVIYGNYNEETGNNSVGYASSQIFALLKF